MMTREQERAAIQATIRLLRACRERRAAGQRVYLTTDPTWLVHMAINRRAGWHDDPGGLRGSAMPVAGRYPQRASGGAWQHLRNLAAAINTPRRRVYASELGEWRQLLMRRIPERFEH